ncbi:MAG: BBP7 family outer membrane beta-barrel protein [Planctomycetota bacterium]
MKTCMTVASLVVALALLTTAVAEETYDVEAGFTGILQEQVVDEGYSTAAVPGDDFCGEPSCDIGPCCPGPSWCFTAGMLIMERSRPEDTTLVTDSYQTGGAELLNGNDLDFGFQGGFEFSAIRRNVHRTCWDLEARYVRIDGWEATRDPVYSEAGAVVQYIRPIGDTEFDGTISGSYDSHFDSFELNLRRPFCCGAYTFLAGFRFAELDERAALTHNIDSGYELTTHDVRAINDLYGFQLGADARLWQCRCWSADTFLRAGVYSNRVVSNVAVTQTGGPDYVARAEDNHTSFLGELGVTATYRLNPCTALTAGYQLMWLEGVAVASDQVAVSDPIGGITAVDTGGSPFYHGAVISLEYCR